MRTLALTIRLFALAFVAIALLLGLFPEVAADYSNSYFGGQPAMLVFVSIGLPLWAIGYWLEEIARPGRMLHIIFRIILIAGAIGFVCLLWYVHLSDLVVLSVPVSTYSI